MWVVFVMFLRANLLPPGGWVALEAAFFSNLFSAASVFLQPSHRQPFNRLTPFLIKQLL
jgi:hypothetical protein